MKLYVWKIEGEFTFWETPSTVINHAGKPAQFIGAIEVEETNTPKTATLTMAGMDDLIRQVSKLSQLAQMFEDGIKAFLNAKIEPPKKTVTKEAVPETESLGALDGSTLIGFRFPKNYHNIKCTYEVEE
jgi:hypothetical protein